MNEANRNDKHAVSTRILMLHCMKKHIFSSFQKVLLLECVVAASATNNTFSLFDIKLNIITVCCSEETQKDLANISQCFAFSPPLPLDNETQTISINTSKAAFCKKRQTTHSDAYLNVLCLLLLCLPCLVCQSRKFHLVQKCKCCEAQGHPLKENNGHRPAEKQTLPLNYLKRH